MMKPFHPMAAAFLLAWSLAGDAIAAEPWYAGNPGEPELLVPANIPGRFGTPVGVPILFTGNGAAVSSILFSVDFDEACLGFDPTDADFDGIPDDVTFSLPPQFAGVVTFDAEDADGELDFTIIDLVPPLVSLPDGTLLTVTLTPLCQPAGTSLLAPVGFSDNPAVSFGGTSGQSVPGTSVDGSVEISDPIFSDGFESGDTSAWAGVFGAQAFQHRGL